MTEARIIEKTIGHPSREDFTFYLIETVHFGGKTHRESDRSYTTEAEARKAAEDAGHDVDQTLYREG